MMPRNCGPERAEAIRALEEQIRRAKTRLESLAATADAAETSFHLRDEADIAYGTLRREVDVMREALQKIDGDGPVDDEIFRMVESLATLRREIEE